MENNENLQNLGVNENINEFNNENQNINYYDVENNINESFAHIDHNTYSNTNLQEINENDKVSIHSKHSNNIIMKGTDDEESITNYINAKANRSNMQSICLFWRHNIIFRKSISSALINANLRPSKKRIFLERYVNLVEKYEIKQAKVRRKYYVFKTLIQSGSLVTPALLSINKASGIDEYQNGIYWSTWGISLVVGIMANLMGLFGIEKRHFLYTKTLNNLKIEGWRFLELSGKYSDLSNINDNKTPILSSNTDENINEINNDKYDNLLNEGIANHENMFSFFCNNIEKLREEELEANYNEVNK